jgi:site-specific DNA-methyltransferase (adenine-specific)
MMQLYWSIPSARIYHGDCRELLAQLDERVDLLLADPPYGVKAHGQDQTPRSQLTASNSYAMIVDDDKPFDPSHLRALDCKQILWGANYYAERLPASSSWIVWDKRAGLPSKQAIGFNTNADCELAWTNLGGPARIYSHRWMGMLKGSERNQRRVYPAQKPVDLMRWCLLRAGLQPEQLVVDPYMGSGPVLEACLTYGLRYIGIDLRREACALAVQRVQRLAREVMHAE